MRGIGDTYLATTNLAGGATAQRLIPNPFFTFNYSADSSPIEAKGFRGGQQQTVGAAKGPITHNLTLETQYIRRADRSLLTGHFAKDFADIIFPVQVTGNVPASSAYEIADADITTGNAPYILVFDDVVGPLVPTASATTAPTSAYEVQINTTANKLIFHSSAAGHAITYTKPYEFSGKGYGGAGAAVSLGELVFRGKCYDFGDEESLIEFPKLNLVNVVEIAISGDVPTYQLQFLAAVPTGWTHPYRQLELATATA